MAYPAKLHDIALADDRRDREAVSHGLPEGAQVRIKIKISLRPTVVPAKPGDHFVQDKQGSVLAAKIAYAIEKIVARRMVGCRLHDQRGNAIGMIVEELLDAAKVIVAKANSQFAASHRNAAVADSGPDKPVVKGKERMVRANSDHVAPSISTREFDGGRGYIRAVLRKFDHIGLR